MSSQPHNEDELRRIVDKVRERKEGLTYEEALTLIEYTAWRELQVYFYARGMLRAGPEAPTMPPPTPPDNDGIRFID